MCGVMLRGRLTSDELLSRMSVGSVFEVVSHNRLRWCGYMKRKSDDDWVKKCRLVGGRR